MASTSSAGANGELGKSGGKAPEVPEDMGKMGKSMWRWEKLQLIKSLNLIAKANELMFLFSIL